MTDPVTRPPLDLDAIARPSGGLAMVAMDQRESLRHMFDQAGAGRVDDERLVAFKLDVARALGPLASGFLIDREYGVERAAPLLPASCGLILAADALEQEPGGPVEETGLDEVVVAPGSDLHGAVAIKLLVIWRRDARREQRVELARRFVEVAAARGVLSVLEPVVRATPGEAITGPWVVLSQGVHRDDFAGAVRAACRGGASGFLAGRALWSDVVGSADVPAALAEVSVPRLERLVELVDAEARPWTAA